MVTKVHILQACSSDHKPLLARMENEAKRVVWYNKRFKGEANWMIDEDNSGVVSKAWEEGGVGGDPLNLVQ